ncbi:MAG: S8 family serine peptidase [Cyclobacteriaceae bacterium]|nr:S8 family serine peptidase [Cyclobacteriaceae bacterium]
MKLGHFVLVLVALINANLATAQIDRAKGLEAVDSAYQHHRAEAEKRITQFLQRSGSGRVLTQETGARIFLVDVSPSGIPIYIKSDNAEVATSLNVDELRSTGSLGLNLEGAGIQVGIWDEGRVRNNHVEFGGRVTQIDNPSSSFNFHATHVMGTMIAAGVNANAKGMAPKATAIAFDFNGDVSEMSGQAKPDQTSIILSNHSYGTLSGWDNGTGNWVWHGDPSISNTIDWKFGFYNSTSRFYDDIAFNAPYYLIVKSAGNDNNDVGDGSRPPDCNPFDCIPTNGVAKNILTVGAVKKLAGPYTGPSDVEITSFSSFGPSDDGRIKPDIVAPGQAVFSTSETTTTSYAAASGTSMSSPATTGTLALLQELYKNLNGGNLMKAATLKALAIHTAREVGTSPGPDFKFGWGLLDAKAAAETIINKDDQNIFIQELTLASGGSFEMNLTPKENEKITATLVWTDPAGPVLAPSLNPTTKTLVNNLNLSLIDDGGTTQFPWKLNGANPSAAATKGINTVDNVEKLEFDLPEPRDYKLRVDHSGTLVNGSQDFSLILTYSSLVDPRTKYYWIGNTGNWNDGTKWSLSSGGVPANAVPGSEDNVIFDENSFSADNQTLSLAQDQQCYSIRWFANENILWSLNSHNLEVGAGINLLTDNITTTSAGSMTLLGLGEGENTVSLGDNDLSDLTIEFDGSASWVLTGDVSLSGINMHEGLLKINGANISINNIDFAGVASKSMSVENTTITGSGTVLIDWSGVELEVVNSSLLCPAASTFSIDFGSNTFAGTIELAGGQLNATGSGEMAQVAGAGTLVAQSDLTWGDISLEAGSILTIQEGSQQTVKGTFDLAGTIGSNVVVQSSGAGLAIINFELNQKICLDHLTIDNVEVTGESTISAGLNSTLTNSPGWVEDDCSNILFADFEVSFNCENASVYFTDKSSGPISSRTWNFGDDASQTNESKEINPIHFFEGPGQFAVTLTISDGTSSDSYLRTISLLPSVLIENRIELNNGKLISFQPAEAYQWVLDGKVLEGADTRSIDFINGFGEYAVLTFDEVCNRRSEPFLVTGFGEDSQTGGLYVYPNPAVDHLNVLSGSALDNIKITDQIGRELFPLWNKTDDGAEIDISEFPRGIYILHVQSESQIFYRRVVFR